MNGHDDVMFDSRIAEWLEDAPNSAPAQIMQTIIAALPSIPQRRTKLVSIDRFAQRGYLGLAAAALVVALVTLTILRWPSIGPAPTPSPSPTLATLSQRVEAPLHRYAAALPADWQVTVGQTVDSPDTFVGPDGTLTVSFELIPFGTGQDAWADAYFRARVAELGGSCLAVRPEDWRPSRVGQEGAYEWDLPCVNGVLYITGVGDRTYPIEYASATGDFSQPERALLRQIVLSFEFDQGPTVLPSPSPTQ